MAEKFTSGNCCLAGRRRRQRQTMPTVTYNIIYYYYYIVSICSVNALITFLPGQRSFSGRSVLKGKKNPYPTPNLSSVLNILFQRRFDSV